MFLSRPLGCHLVYLICFRKRWRVNRVQNFSKPHLELRNRLREEKWNFKSLSLCSEMGQRGLPGPSSAIIIYRTSKEFYTLYVWNTLYAHTSDNCLVLFRRQTPSTSWDTDAALFMYFNCTLPALIYWSTDCDWESKSLYCSMIIHVGLPALLINSHLWYHSHHSHHSDIDSPDYR